MEIDAPQWGHPGGHVSTVESWAHKRRRRSRPKHQINALGCRGRGSNVVLRLKMRAGVLALLALFIVSGIAASTSSAAGPYWRVNGSRLEKGSQAIKLQNKGALVLKSEISTTPITITCNRSISEASNIEGNLTNQGLDKGHISYTSCKSSVTNCEVVEPVTTSETKSYLAIAATQTKIVDVFEPTTGEAFTTITLKGGTCLLAGPHEVKGSVAAEIIPAGVENQEGLMVFPSTPIKKVKHEGTEITLVALTLGAKEATFAGVYGARLASGEKFGVFET
jgi:hypothetical protein